MYMYRYIEMYMKLVNIRYTFGNHLVQSITGIILSDYRLLAFTDRQNSKYNHVTDRVQPEHR